MKNRRWRASRFISGRQIFPSFIELRYRGSSITK
jgi:hypothetical protein